MRQLNLRPYHTGDDPRPGSVPVSVVVLTLNEEANIRRCLSSVAWAEQVVVVDSGSSDGTLRIARALGAETVDQPWLGFSAQREFALRLALLRHDWVYFVDADQWISPQLAAEVAVHLTAPACAAFAHRFRLVFLGTWIRHCGWYGGSWNVQLMDRRYARYPDSLLGERIQIDGEVHRLRNDIVDDDAKGLPAWLHKHVGYAQLEAERRGRPLPLRQRLHAVAASRGTCRPLARSVLKEVIFPSIPAKPAAMFLYMYFIRLGLLDGLPGLRFCFYHAWFQACVSALRSESAGASHRGA